MTPWNVDKLREAVIAGPGRNPGAVAVEDERGRVILLRKDRKVGGAGWLCGWLGMVIDSDEAQYGSISIGRS